MKRTTASPERIEALERRVQVLGDLGKRLALSSYMGIQYSGEDNERDLYRALGYPLTISYNSYLAKYRRQDLAKAVIDRPVKATWRGEIQVLESDDDTETALEREWKQLMDDLQLKNKLTRLDKLTGLGTYGVLLLGTSDITVGNRETMAEPINMGKNLKLMYVMPFGENHAQIERWVDDPGDARFGKPLLYRLSTTNPGNSDTKSDMLVHHSRVLHVVEDALENDIEGTPRLEALYNRLMDAEKVVGGDAEMFWRGARPGYAANIKEGYKMTTTELEAWEDQLDEYEHDLRRILSAEGMDMQALAQQVADPKGHVDIIIQMVAAVTGIPKRILTGSERGELSSTQDQDEWNAYVTSRREEFVEPCIIRALVDKLVELRILSKPAGDGTYSIQWDELFSMGDKDKAEIGKTRAEAIAKYAGSAGAEAIIPPRTFLRIVMGLSDEEIELVEQEAEAWVQENPVTEEEEEIIEEEGNEPPEDTE